MSSLAAKRVSARLNGACPSSRFLNRIDRKRLAVEIFQAKVEDLVETAALAREPGKPWKAGGT